MRSFRTTHVRKHGGVKRPIWRKIHTGIDEEPLDVGTMEVTTRHMGDAPLLPESRSNPVPSVHRVRPSDP